MAQRGRDRGGARVGGLVDLVSLGASVQCCVCGTGVTDARGCSARLGAASPQSPCQKCCSRTRRVHVAASAVGGGGGGWEDAVRRDRGE